MTIKEGNYQDVSSIKAYYSDGSTKNLSLSDSSLTYTSLNTYVATVSNGRITAKEEGTATIKVYYFEGIIVNDSVAVKVPGNKVLKSIIVSPADMSLEQGEYQYITSIIANYSDGSAITVFLSNPNLEYISSDGNIAEIDKYGKILAKSFGTSTVTIKFYDNGITVEDKITVIVDGEDGGLVQVEITNIGSSSGDLIDPFEFDKWYDAIVYFHKSNTGTGSGTIEVKPKSDSGIIYNPTVKYFEYNDGTSSVSRGFDYQFVGSGTTRELTFELYDQATGIKLDEYTSETLHIMQPDPHLDYIESVPSSTSLQKLDFFYFSSDYLIKAHFDDGHIENWTDYNKFLFESSDEYIAYVEEHGGICGIGVGTASITITYKEDTSKKANLTVTVDDEPPPPTKTLTSLTVSPDTMSFITAGQTKYISAITLGWSDGTTSSLAQGNVAYSGYNTSVAKVFMTIPNVKVESVGEGSTNIKVSYTDNGVTKYDYISVSVEYAPAELQYIEAYPKNMAFDLNDANKCDDVTQVAAFYSDGSWENIDINSVNYLSNNTGVATVNSGGTVCGVGEGNTTIKVTYQGEYDTISVSVTDSGITPPSVSTSDAFNQVDPNGDAYIGVPGKIQATGGENAYERGFEYQDLAGGSVHIKNAYGDYGVGSWYRPLYIGSEIYSGHSYKYRAYAVNSAGTGYGVWRTFTVETSVVPPTVTTLKVINITTTTAYAFGRLDSTGGENAYKAGIYYKDTVTGITKGIYWTGDYEAGDTWSLTLTDLIPDRNYEYRAYAENSAGKGYGDWDPFKTEPPPPTKTLTSLTVVPDTMNFTDIGQQKDIQEIILGWSDDTTTSLAEGNATYYSYNTSVADVTGTSLIKVESKGEGDTQIKVSYTDNGVTKSDYIDVHVGIPPPVKTLTSLTVIPDTMTFITAGQDKYISQITLGWSDGSTGYLAQGDATYSGYDTAVAKVFMTIPNVKVQSVGEGSTNIKVSYTDNGVTKYDYIAVSVEYEPAELLYIEAYPKNMAFDLDDTNKCDDVTQVAAWYSDGSWKNIDINSVSYLSNDTGVATVNSSGTVCGVGEGNTTIKVTYQGENDTISVSVSDSGITPPSVSTSDAFNKVDPYGDAYIGVPGKIQATGGENAYERGFEYQDLAGGSVHIKNAYGDYGVGSWYRPLYIGSEIYSGHSYKYRAYAVNSAGTGYGVWRTFTVN